MKQGKTISNILVCILAVGVVLYFLLSLWQSFTDPFTTTIAYDFTISDSVEAQGLLLRNEVPLPSSNGLLDLLRSEGEQVGAGQIVARSFKDSTAMLQQAQLETYETQVSLLDYALAGDDAGVSVAKLNQDIVLALGALRTATATDNYNQLESQVAQVKGSVLRRDYIFGDTSVALELEQQRQLLLGQITSLSQQVLSGITDIRTPVSGSFSVMIDGFESITPDQAFTLDLPGLQALLDTPTHTPANAGGKIITGNTWYFVLSLPTDYTTQLQTGRSLTLRFSGDFNQDISMTLEQISRDQGDHQVLVLSTDRYLEQTTLLRQQQVDVIYQSYSGLRIPKMALRMHTSTNSQGETTETLGVYVVSAGYAEFKPVKLVTEGPDYYVVAPFQDNANALRAGNEVIVNAVGLYHGKLLEY